MIVDKVSNGKLYKGMSPLIDKALEIMPTINAQTALGRCEVDGLNLFYTVMEYEAGAESEKSYEYHKNYIDIQQILAGEESIVYQNVAKLAPSIAYDAARDIGFMAGKGSKVTLNAGEFMLVFSEDAHKPGIGSGKVKKAVFKVKIQ